MSATASGTRLLSNVKNDWASFKSTERLPSEWQPTPEQQSSIATANCGSVNLFFPINTLYEGDACLFYFYRNAVGGSTSLPSGLPSPYYEGFTGCIDHVKVDRHHLDWHRHGDNAILHYCDDTWIGPRCWLPSSPTSLVLSLCSQ